MHGFELTIPLSAVTTSEGAGQVAGQVSREVLSLLAVVQDEMSRKQLQEVSGLKGRDNFEKLYLKPALAAGVLEMTIPNKPKSRMQKYRLTEKGKSEVQKALLINSKSNYSRGS